MTTPERHNQVYEIFAKARELEGDKRRAFLDQACGDDSVLRAEVEALLGRQGELGGFMEESPQFDAAVPESPELETQSSAQSPGAAGAEPDRDPPHVAIEGYEIVRELHRGGQGVVHQAIQKSTKRKVAIKLLREGPYASKSAKIRFEREIEFAAQLRHPNIVAVFESGTTPQGWQYYVMDYVRGLPLNQHIRENKLTLEQTLEVFSAACDAVQYAHHKGVIHRDLKPSNILIDSEGQPKILDFGLAKQMLTPVETIVSVTQQVIGTLPYMSPEQARGNPDHIDSRTDIYALGVILYEILTGHYPYPVAGQMAEVLQHIAETPPTPPTRQWTPDSGVTKRSSKHLRAGKCPIDDELQTVILKTLSKERERRYQSAGDLAKDLGHYLAGRPIEAKRDSGWYVLKKALGRHKSKISVAAAFVVLIGAFWVYQARTARKGESNGLVDEGRVLAIRQHWVEAGELFREARRIDPGNSRALYFAAWWNMRVYFLESFEYDDLARLEEASNLCHKAIEIEPDRHTLWNLKSVIFMTLGDYGEAEKACRRVLDLAPTYYAAYGNLAKILALQGKLQEAREIATTGAQAIPETAERDQYADEVWRALGTIQLHLGDPQALDSLMRAKEIDSKDFRNTLLLAHLHLTLPGHKNFGSALDEARTAANYTGLRDPRFQRILAQAYLRNGQNEDAVTNAEAALSKGDMKAICHLISAIAKAQMGDRDAAAEDLASAIENWPDEFKSGDGIIVTAEKELLWFDTAAELQALRTEAKKLVSTVEASGQ